MNWSAFKAVLNDWPAPQLRDLLHELYKLNEENHRFIHARLVPSQASVEVSRSELKRILSASSVYNGKFHHADAKRIIDQYAKATNNRHAVASAMS